MSAEFFLIFKWNENFNEILYQLYVTEGHTNP
jgi:hypothetical protein